MKLHSLTPPAVGLCMIFVSFWISCLSQNYEMVPFCPVSDELGNNLCASDPPVSILAAVAKTQCVLECVSRGAACAAIKYNRTTQECSIYIKQPTQFSNDSSNCLTFQPKTSGSSSGDHGIVRYVNLGCFFDNSTRDLTGINLVSRNLTRDNCLDFCHQNGFLYTGVQFGTNCFCGNKYGRYGVTASCGINCGGDASQICGGRFANNILRGINVANIKDNCSFPFTYQGQLYYQCMKTVYDAANVCNKFACVTPMSRMLATCSPAITDYLAINQTITISIPSFNETYPVISVNNWIVFQQRLDSSTIFSLGWSSYKSGFGLYNGNYWMGLEKVYQMTKSGPCRARVEILNDLNQWLSMEYRSFSLGSENTNYTIHITGYSGELSPDPMNFPSTGLKHNGMAFSTIDSDHDKNPLISCASVYGGGGGWWWNNCQYICLTGEYNSPNFAFGYDDYDIVNSIQRWHQLKTSRMMVRCN